MFTFLILILNIFLFCVMAVLINKLGILARKIEELRGTYNKFAQQSNEHLKVFRDLAHEEGFCIEEKTTILNESAVVTFGAEPRIGKLLRLVESPESKKDREQFEHEVLPTLDKVIEDIKSGKAKPIKVGVDIKKKKV